MLSHDQVWLHLVSELRCPVCRKVFPTESSIVSHFEAVHSESESERDVIARAVEARLASKSTKKNKEALKDVSICFVFVLFLF